CCAAATCASAASTACWYEARSADVGDEPDDELEPEDGLVAPEPVPCWLLPPFPPWFEPLPPFAACSWSIASSARDADASCCWAALPAWWASATPCIAVWQAASASGVGVVAPSPPTPAAAQTFAAASCFAAAVWSASSTARCASITACCASRNDPDPPEAGP